MKTTSKIINNILTTTGQVSKSLTVTCIQGRFPTYFVRATYCRGLFNHMMQADFPKLGRGLYASTYALVPGSTRDA